MNTGTLAMIFGATVIVLLFLLLVIFAYIIRKHNNAARGHHLCEIAKLGGGCYRDLFPIDSHGEIRIPQHIGFTPFNPKTGKKGRSYFTDRIHTFTDRWPYGWPAWLQATVPKSYFMEDLSDAILPPIMDKDGKVLGFQQILTAEYMANLDREKVTEQVVGYGDREQEITQAIRGLPKPWMQWVILIAVIIGPIIVGILSFMIYSRLGNMVVTQATGG